MPKIFSYKDITVVILGRMITGIQGVKYKSSQEKEEVMGRGNKPLAIVSGAKKYSGKITLLQYELDALNTAVKLINPNYNITDVSFDIVISYGEGSLAKTDIVKSAEITEYEKGMEGSDKSMSIELPFIALDVEEDV